MTESSLELVNEYKDQVRILKQEVAELQDAGKSKDSANKRCLQKLEYANADLEKATDKIKELESKMKELKSGKTKHQKEEAKD
jgi:chromosome segregation ATPase|tara:strand:+ start:293 stop:541 length:249 start_codon:yes stop_codon:yes gene_type:complete